MDRVSTEVEKMSLSRIEPLASESGLLQGRTIAQMEELFRQAANEGKTDLMLEIYQTEKSINVSSKGAKSGMSAAHRAASKGHASVLRLLHNLGDTFDSKDVSGFLPEKYASNRECQEVFHSVAAGKKTLKAVEKVFSQRDYDGKFEKRPHIEWRKQKEKAREQDITSFSLAVNKCMTDEIWGQLQSLDGFHLKNRAAEEILAAGETLMQESQAELAAHVDSYIRHHSLYFTLDYATKTQQKIGLCGECSDVAFGYLVSAHEIPYAIEEVGMSLTKNNHAFVLLNRDQSSTLTDLTGWKKALLVDGYLRRTFFYEFQDVIENPDVRDYMTNLQNKKIAVLNSNQKITVADEGSHPFKTIELVEENFNKLYELMAQKFAQLKNS